MTEPAYQEALRNGRLAEMVAAARNMLRDCHVCPRDCGVNRLQNQKGFCGIGRRAVVSSAGPHFGEETPLVGDRGSGTIFFASCNLKCLFCQNYEISHLMEGAETDSTALAEIMLGLQATGCLNINFVTPTHVLPQILEAVELAARRGLSIPLVYNTGGYDSVETLRMLDGVIDIYMPDIKFMDSPICKDLMDAENYPEVVREAIREMYRQVGDLQVDECGIARRGLLVRHLVMPNNLAATREAMRFLAEQVSRHTYVNIMDQYRPCGRAGEDPRTARSITREEYAAALEDARVEHITRLDSRSEFRRRVF